MTDGVDPAVTINFQLNEPVFIQTTHRELGCSLKEFQQAMRVVICCRFGYALRTLQRDAALLRKFACGELTDNIQYDDAQILLDLLMLLPGYNTNRSQKIRDLEALSPDYGTKQKQQRTLASCKTYILFDHYLTQWWEHATSEDRIRFFPVYFWWKVTAILPLRPTECVLTPRDCIRKDRNRYYLTVRRTQLKGTKQAETYYLDQDYRKAEYPVPEELGTIIEQYILKTQAVYESSIDTLFCKATQFSSLGIKINQNGYYSYSNLRQCLNHFYDDVLVGQFGLTISDTYDPQSSQHTIGHVNLGDTRHIAMVSLMVSGGSPSACCALADHEGIDISSNYYTNIESFLDVVSRERYRIYKAENEQSSDNPTTEKLLSIDKSLPINGGYCQSNLAKHGDFSHCACAVTTEGGFGDCYVCLHFVPLGTTLPAYESSVSKEMHATYILLKQAVETIRQVNGCSESLSDYLDRFQARALQYMRMSTLAKLIKETE